MSTKQADFVGQQFVITREFSAPRELVFKACTEAKHLAQWWGPTGFSTPVCEWDVRPGGKINVVMRSPDGEDYPMGGEVREVVPPERLVTMTGLTDADGKFVFQFLHTMTLEERAGKTKLTMHSRVIMATPDAAQYIGGFEEGMTLTLGRLAEHLERKTDPLVVERVFNAPIEKVWHAITDKDAMREWYFELAAFKPEVGFEFEFTVEHAGMSYHHLCKITEMIPQKRLVHTWRYAGHPGNSLVSFDLLAEGKKTRLRLTHTGLESFPAGESFKRENFQKGWTSLIGEELKKFVE
jgi:uncharacterized protein YndB with AHSA1/START domain